MSLSTKPSSSTPVCVTSITKRSLARSLCLMSQNWGRVPLPDATPEKDDQRMNKPIGRQCTHPRGHRGVSEPWLFSKSLRNKEAWRTDGGSKRQCPPTAFTPVLLSPHLTRPLYHNAAAIAPSASSSSRQTSYIPHLSPSCLPGPIPLRAPTVLHANPPSRHLLSPWTRLAPKTTVTPVGFPPQDAPRWLELLHWWNEWTDE